MRKRFLALPLAVVMVFFNSCKSTNSEKPLLDPILQENLDNLVLVEGFESEGNKYNFKIGRYEVTQELYETVMGTNPSYYKNNPAPGENQKRRPIEFVSWYDAISFCNKLTTLTMGEKECCYTITNIVYKTDDDEAAKEKAIKETPTYVTFIKSADVVIDHTKKGFRLPTKEEWLFAAKGGLKSQNFRYAGSNNIGEVGWSLSNSGKKTHEVGMLKPNELGLYDMTGNVNEFCEDLAFYTNTRNEVFPRRVSCGGSSFYSTVDSLLTKDDEALESPGNGGQGFRIVCSEIK